MKKLEGIELRGYIEATVEDRYGRVRQKEVQKNTITDGYLKYLLYQSMTTAGLVGITRATASGNLVSAAVQQYKDAIKEIDDETYNLQDNIIRAITGTDVMSAIDQFAEAYIEAWSAGEDKAKGMRDVVKNIVRASVTELAKGKISEKTGEFMNALKDAMADETLSAAEEKALDNMRAAMEHQMDSISSSFNKYLLDDDDDRKASAKTTVGMSQDTADELNGLFYAIANMSMSLDYTTKNMLNNSAAALNILAGIEGYTKNLSRLENIENDLNTVKKGIDNICLKGVSLK
jgi:hypothetical protein